MLSDKLLEAKINSALADHVNVAMAPAGVIVSAANGRGTLAGVTSSGGLRAKAEQVTQRSAGVCDIDNCRQHLALAFRLGGADGPTTSLKERTGVARAEHDPELT